MDSRTRARIGIALAIALVAATLVVLGLWTVYGLAVEYGGGAIGDVAFLVVPIPTLAAAGAVALWPGLPARARVATVLGTAALMLGGGLVADELGQAENHERLLEESGRFTCNGPNSEVRVPEAVDRTWRELPRQAPIYGPVQGGPTDCVAAVSGEGRRTFAAYTRAFRGLDGWYVEEDGPARFVMSRDDVRVTVRLTSDGLTTIQVGLSS
jgi:hypothetical protein